MKSILVSSLIGGGAISYAISYMTEPKPNAAMSVIYTQPQSASAWWWSQIMWWLIPVALLLFVFGGAFHLFGSAYTRLKYPAHRKLSVAEAKRDAGIYEVERERKSLQVGTALARAQEREARAAGQAQPVEITPEPAYQQLTIHQAIEQSTERSWIIGQACQKQPNRETSRQAVGSLLTVDYRTTQFAILGGSGGGKTSSTGMMFLLYAKRFGLHPIVLDGKDGLDFGPLSDRNVIEWYKATPDNLAGFLRQLKAIYDERLAIARKAGAANIYELPASMGIQPLFVMIEEFGRVWEASGYSKEIETAFNDLFSLGRACGIIVCPIDQAPEGWSKPMRSSAKFAVCYSAQGDAIKAFGEHYMAELPLKGVFSRGNVFYRAWHTMKLIDMRKLSPIQRRYLVEPKLERRVEPSIPSVPATPMRIVPPQEVERTGTSGTVELESTVERAPLVVVPPNIARKFHGSTGNKWGGFCEEMFKRYHDMTMEQLQEAMASVAGGQPGDYKSRAFRGYHRFSKNGDKAKVQGYMEIAA